MKQTLGHCVSLIFKRDSNWCRQTEEQVQKPWGRRKRDSNKPGKSLSPALLPLSVIALPDKPNNVISSSHDIQCTYSWKCEHIYMNLIWVIGFHLKAHKELALLSDSVVSVY